MIQEFEPYNIKVYGGPQLSATRLEAGKSFESMQIVDAVLVAYDINISMPKIYSAYYALQHNAKFYATNMDLFYRLDGKNLLAPDVGAWVKGLMHICNENPIVVGKPNKISFETIMEQMHVKEAEILMIGDTLMTDIQGAINSKIHSCLKLGGISSIADIEKTHIYPTYVLSNLT